jgi:hypothetical protein
MKNMHNFFHFIPQLFFFALIFEVICEILYRILIESLRFLSSGGCIYNESSN